MSRTGIDAAGDPSAMARWLWQQHRRRAPFQAIPNLATLASAYDVQEHLVTLLSQHGQGRIAGYKVGLTSPRMQSLCNIDHPIAGAVLSKRVHQAPARVHAAAFGHLGIECELALKLGRRVRGEVTPERLGDSIEAIAAAFELVDDRRADYARLEVRTLVADNSWNAGIVLGAPAPMRKLTGLRGALEVDGAEVDEGSSSDVLGDPLAAAAWLARHLDERGTALEAGQWVMTGSIVPTRFAGAGERYRFCLDSLPPVELLVQ
ncbi:MAG: fumarylacetoacetate hydrolase family protein [Pseudomonadota bacterium]|nr:fumarylacetoacetate hydrolase family protein [Pseudomonadota bacterium]